MKLVQCPTRLKAEVFTTGSHDHAPVNDQAVVFKKVVRDFLDRAIANSRRIGAKNLRADLKDNFGDNHPDIPSKDQVGPTDPVASAHSLSAYRSSGLCIVAPDCPLRTDCCVHQTQQESPQGREDLKHRGGHHRVRQDLQHPQDAER